MFIVATTGQGEPPSNMRSFWDFLLIKNLPADSLQGMRYAIFGMGNSKFQCYNHMAKKLEARLQQLSAKPFFRTGLGDQNSELGYYGQFVQWKTELLNCLHLKNFAANTNFLHTEIQQVDTLSEASGYQSSVKQVFSHNQFSAESVVAAKVEKLTKITPDGYDKTVTEVRIACPGQCVPGQTVAILPCNNAALVEWFMKYFKLNAGQFLSIQYKKGKAKKGAQNVFPSPLAADELFTQWLDIASPPSRQFLQMLSGHVKDEQAKQRLAQLGSDDPEGLRQYNSHIIQEKRSIQQVLEEFSVEDVKLEELIQSTGLIRPREYSVSNYESDRIRLVVQLEETVTPLLHKHFTGLCSGYLGQRVKEGDQILLYKNKPNLDFPKDLATPVLMFCIGTGIAPFLSYLQFRTSLLQQHTHEEQKGPDAKPVLYFGCRHPDKDCYYKEFLHQVEQNQV